MYYKVDGSAALVSAANDGVNLWATGSGQTLQGGALNDVLGGAGGDTLIGGAGDNQYYLSGTGNVIVQDATGVNTVTTWMSYTLPDNIQNLNVTGDNLYAAGNSLDNLITVGDSNNMTLYGAAGNNVLVGGAGRDVFIVDGTAGSNAIYNWHAGDALQLMGGTFHTFAQVQAAMTQVGSDVVLKNGLNDLVIRNTTVSQFQASDFYLSLDASKLGQLTFDDEFNALSLRTASNPNGTWTPEYGDGSAYADTCLGSHTLTGNNELQIYTYGGFKGTNGQDLGLNPFSISNGVLDIRAQTVDAATSANMWNYGYSSGLITTHQTFSQLYGYFEMRAELPTDVSGAWPAFWLLPADGSWPPELDVMETLSGSPNIDYTTAHSQSTGSHTAVGSANLVTNDGGFHTYGVLWTATTLTWFLDGQEVFQTATPDDMHKPVYMLANMAVGGWAGTPDFASTDMYVDYIRAYGLSDGSSTWTSSVTPDTPSGPATAPTSVSTPASGSTGVPGSTGAGSAAPPTVVSVSDTAYTAPEGIVSITLTGAGQTVTGNAGGDTFISNNNGNHLIGGAGNDTFVMGRGGDVAAGGAGTNKFVLPEIPWAGDEITDFGAGQNTLDLRGMLAQAGYRGSDAVADGYLKITADANGAAQVWASLEHVTPGSGWWLAVTLDGVSPSSLQLQNGLVTLASGGSAASGGATGGGSGGPSAVVITDAAYTAPDGVTSITLNGSIQTVTGNGAGDSFFVANNNANHISGGAGDDTFILGRGGDVVTGGGGADHYVFNETPWAAGHITDFDPAHDVIDLSGLLARSGYAGSNPIGDGYIKLVADGSGGTQIWSDLDQIAHAGWWLVTALDGVSVSSVAMQGDTVTAAPAPAQVTVSAAAYTAPAGVIDITLSGSQQTVTGNDAGDTFHSNNSGNHLIGGAGADTFAIGRGGDVVTGGGGADTFAFAETPWAGAHITDFTPGVDAIDLSGLLAHDGYTGSDPVADGYVKVEDAAGGAQVWSNLDPVSPGSGWWLVATLDNVSAAGIHVQGAFVTG
jgi:beta-glucanase (GH16 family)